jgi:tetratricopeptide (TPR) repeat protein
MKIVHRNTESDPATKYELLQKAREAEEREDYSAAEKLYEKVIKKDHLEENAYNRLFIMYRKLGEYQKELDMIDAGIEAFEKFFASHRPKKSDKINSISKKLSKSLGLTDKKGNSVYSPEPIGKWKRRRVVVEKKVKSL